MFDVIMRAFLHPLDYAPALKRRPLILKEVIRESETIYSFIFTTEKPFSWKAGQHGIFYFPSTPISGKWWRAFSIASAQSEGVIRISTIIKENPSDFKKKLLNLTVGDTIIMRGPFGEFHVSSQTKHIIGIAGGIGITPFRALIAGITTGEIKHTRLTLIYSAVSEHTFKEAFTTSLDHKNVEIIYTSTPEEINDTLAKLVAKYADNSYYFISGSPGMITAIRIRLCNLGMRHIINDSFKGY